MDMKLLKYYRLRWLKDEIRPINKVNLKRTPVEPYAFIRVKNEKHTVKACLDSIKDVIKKGLLLIIN